MAKTTKDTKAKPKTKKSTAKESAKKNSAKKAVGAKSTVKNKTAATKAKKTTSAKKSPASKKTTAVKKTTTTKTGRKVEVISTKKTKRKPLKGYSKKDLNEFKKVILAKRDEIVELLQNLKEQMMDTSTGQYVNENTPYSLHMAEQGTDAQEREKLYLWAQRETKFLSYLEDALQRIENGTYGICIDSLTSKEGPHLIPKARLLAVPHTQHCVACKTKNAKKK